MSAGAAIALGMFVGLIVGGAFLLFIIDRVSSYERAYREKWSDE